VELSPEALREIADWLDLSDEYMRETIDLLEDSEDTLYVRSRIAGDAVQKDIRRWADEMELDG